MIRKIVAHFRQITEGQERVSWPLFGVALVALMTITGGWVLPRGLDRAPRMFAAVRVDVQVAQEPASPTEGAPVEVPPVTEAPALEPTVEVVTPTAVATFQPPVEVARVSEASDLAGPTTASEFALVEPTATPLPTVAPDPSRPMPAGSPPTRIVIPTINLDQRIIPVGWHQETVNAQIVSVWDVAQYAVGWHKNSQYPGQGGNVVLAGHNNIYGEVFRYLENLRPGDVITLYADGRAYAYAVDSSVIVQEAGVSAEQQKANARWIGPFPEERLTLVACWPYTGNSHRILVIAKPLSQPS